MENTILSVSALSRIIQGILEESFDGISVSGELSNYKQHSSGHRYFTLKDANAQIRGVMWRGTTLNFQPTDGMKVVVKGRLSVYPPQGTYQIDCRSMQPLGIGDLQIAFEALKRKLFEQGYFDAERKRPLPRFPHAIGVATSPTGAAIRDILSTLERRMPACTIYLRPTIVQGEEASADIAQAIRDLNETDADILIVGRGGGSIEDLWAFNTEEVAHAILNSRIPVISAVGHEIDVTIADFVADLRAATPTAAAELATRDRTELLSALLGTEEFFKRLIRDEISTRKKMLDHAEQSSAFRRPLEFLRRFAQELDENENALEQQMRRTIGAKSERLTGISAHLRSLYPLAPLKKGFALLKKNGVILGAEDKIEEDEEISLERFSENLLAIITKKSQKQ